MPRRQATKEVPRWRRGQQSAAPQLVFSGRQAKKLARQVAATQLAHPQTATPGATKAANDVLAKTGAYRFRRHLIPFWWLLAVASAGQITHEAHAAKLGLILGLAAAAGIWLLTRHLGSFTRHASEAMAILTALWLPALALAGFTKPLPPILLACWLCVLVPWAKHYRVRPQEAAAADPAPGDRETWTKLAAKRKWSGHLDSPEEIPGGRRWRIVLDGSETDIGEVMAQPRKIAAAWGKPMTEAYAEPSPDGVESRGTLTILRESTLETIREWDGSRIDPQTGMAVIGRFPDGQPMHGQFFARRDGVSHWLVAGTTGSGKSQLLSLLLCLAVTSGLIVPVILDPQEGQSFPKCWRDRFHYARGVDECMIKLRGLHAGMLDRSRDLSDHEWTDDDGTRETGMEFFDPFLARRPIILIVLDEAPALLKDKKYGLEAVDLVGDIAKRGRKAGVEEVLAAGVPSLSELGDQALRDMLVGGNVACLRTANKVAAGMIGLEADPSALPKHFRSMAKTYGLGYVVGPDGRQAPGRIDLVPKRLMVQIATQEPCAVMDDRFAAAMDRATAMGGVQLPLPSAAAPLAAIPPPPDDEGSPGRTAADAVLAVLDREGGELDRGELVKAAGKLATGEWGRAKPFSVRAIQYALTQLVGENRIAKPHDNTYAPIRPSIHLVAETAPETATGSKG